MSVLVSRIRTARPPLRHSSARRLVLAVAAAAATGAAVGAAIAWGAGDQRTALLVGLCLVGPAPIVIRVVQGRFDPFEPIQILAIVICTLFVIRPLAELHYGLTTYGPFFIRDGFDGALLIHLLGITALYLGYFLPPGRRLAGRVPAISPNWDFRRAGRFATCLFGLAVLMFVVFALPSGGLSGLAYRYGSQHAVTSPTQASTAWIYLGPYMCIPAALIALLVLSHRRTPAMRVLFVVAVLSALALTLPRGQRTYLLVLLVPLIALPFVRRMRRPSGLAVIVGLVVAVLAMNILLRERSDRRQGPLTTAVTALAKPGQQFKDFITGPDPSEFSVAALEYQVVPKDVPFSPGITPLSILAGPVPGTLWPDKPRPATLRVTSYLFYPQSLVARASNWPAIFGDMYADFGFPAVALYSLLAGIAVRLLFEYFRRHETNPSVQLLFVAELPLLVVFLRTGITDALAQSLVMVGPILLCAWYATRGTRTATRRAQSRVAAASRA